MFPLHEQIYFVLNSYIGAEKKNKNPKYIRINRTLYHATKYIHVDLIIHEESFFRQRSYITDPYHLPTESLIIASQKLTQLTRRTMFPNHVAHINLDDSRPALLSMPYFYPGPRDLCIGRR